MVFAKIFRDKYSKKGNLPIYKLGSRILDHKLRDGDIALSAIVQTVSSFSLSSPSKVVKTKKNPLKSILTTTILSTKRPSSQPTLGSPSRAKKAKKGTPTSLAVTSQKVSAIETRLTREALSVTVPISSVIPTVTVVPVAQLPTASVTQITEATILPDDETPTIGPEIALLEASQQTVGNPLKGNLDRTNVNPSDNVDEPSTIAKEGETESGDAAAEAVAAETVVVPANHSEAEAHPEAEVEVADENPTSCEAPEAEDVDTIRASAEARDEDLPITFAANAGDMEDDDEDEDGDSPDLPDAGEDLGNDDDEDDDDDDFTIQYQRPSRCHERRRSQGFCIPGEHGEKEKETPEKKENTKSKEKGVVEERNLKAFPFSLKDRDKDRLYSVPPISVATWNQMARNQDGTGSELKVKKSQRKEEKEAKIMGTKQSEEIVEEKIVEGKGATHEVIIQPPFPKRFKQSKKDQEDKEIIETFLSS
ncbi:nucleolin-like [Cynara cardunculus var. scolymus]|uniref:nucleolin-like n=1 Tax=Cynara cardunculus var. scolymus TaxID=59895 RepID=UPI000D6299D8|nr:nucleolin-like [Cynara cardunculus var. scolymus]